MLEAAAKARERVRKTMAELKDPGFRQQAPRPAHGTPRHRLPHLKAAEGVLEACLEPLTPEELKVPGVPVHVPNINAHL